MTWSQSLAKAIDRMSGKRARRSVRIRANGARLARPSAKAHLISNVPEGREGKAAKKPRFVLLSQSPALLGQPAILGGTPAFKEKYSINRPVLPDVDALVPALREIFASRQVTNGKYVRQLESDAAKYVGAKHAIAVSSCSAGLMLAYRALNLARGKVVLPSYTFTMSANAALWNGLTPVFCDCDPQTWNIDVDKLLGKLTDQTVAISATHLFGNPCDVEAIANIARDRGLAVIYDSAHALGSVFPQGQVGTFGDVNVYSLSPTKIITTAGEGGLITTNDDGLAQTLRVLRNYGVTADYDCALLGFNCRMTEFQALVGLALLPRCDGFTREKNRLVALYKRELDGLPGIAYQRIVDGALPTFKDFNILVSGEFGLTRDQIGEALKAENIEVRYYYYPPIHAQSLYAPYLDGPLPATERVTSRVITLPLYPDMPEADVRTVAAVLRRLHVNRGAVKAKLEAP